MTPSSDDGRGHETRAGGEPGAARDGETAGGARALVAAVGASAGGLEALKLLLGAVPEDARLALVVVQHLSPTHESQLVPALEASCRLPVVKVQDGMPLAAGRVHVIPPDATLVLEGGRLRLRRRDRSERPPLPIDALMRSLAAERGADAVGVVLSGTGSDGTEGLKAIRAAGGRTYAQAPATAQHDGMPRSAIAADAVEVILPPQAIAADLVALARGATPPSEAESAEDADGAAEAEEGGTFRQVLHLLRVRVGVDVSSYKPTTLRRRIARRVALVGAADEAAYLRRLRDDPQELTALHDDLFIHVTRFFRDPELFAALREQVFPALLADRGRGQPLRIWVPGCASGEEAYSLAIAALEVVEGRERDVPIQVFGSDISERAIRLARAAEYGAGIGEDVSPERLARFFEQTPKGFRIARPVREACVFVRHDVTADPPFSRIDLLSCRNVLIYFGARLQKQVVPILHYALNDPGYLVLGRSEALSGYGELFTLMDQRQKIFARRPGAGRIRAGPPRGAGATAPAGQPAAARPGRAHEVHRALDLLLLSRYVPAAVLVNDALEIVQVRGRTGAYLEHAPGAASLNLLKLARDGLAADLTQLVDRARAENAPVRKEAVRLQEGGGVSWLDLEVAPLADASLPGRHFLVVFRERGPPPDAGRAAAPGPEDRPLAAGLREELAASKAYVSSVIEQYAATNQALAESNEELQATNEELQSANEELETAKEELQSTNEELTTVNDELQARYHEVNELGNDLQNLVASADIPLVIVDRERRVRRFTPRARSAFNLIPGDVGRAIAEIRPNVDAPDLDAWIAEVIESAAVKEAEVRDRDGRWQRLQIRPYQTADRRVEGAVVSLVDVHALKEALTEARRTRDFAAAALETVPIPVVVLDAALRVTSANDAFYEVFRVTPAAAAGRPLDDVAGPWRVAALAARIGSALERGAGFQDLEVEHDVDGADRRVVLASGRVIPEAPGGSRSLVLALQDVTERRRAEEAHARARTEEVQRFLNEAGAAMLPESLDYDATLAALAHLVVPRLADWCLVDLVEPGGAIRQAAVAHLDPAREERARALRRELPPEADPERGIAWVIRTGTPVIHPEVEDVAWLAGALGLEHPELLRELGAGSYVSVPLRGRTGVIGALTALRGIPGGRYEAEDLAVLEGLGQRAGLAVENARLYLAARQALVARDEFLAVLSHELRNPLAPLRNALYLLDRVDPAAAEAQRAREVATRQVAHLTRLVDDLLDVARVAHGKVELRTVDLDLTDLVRGAAEDHRLLMERRGIEFVVETPPEPLFVHGDAARLVQVVGNLLQNARKFTGAGGRVTLTLARADGAAEVRVSDTGAGIDRDLLHRLFKPFTQARQTLARTEGGLGLGLSLVRWLVDLHGGTVAAASDGPRRGASFVVRLPLLASAPPRAPAPAAKRPAAPRRVLVVDDNHDAAESLADLVRLMGHEAEVAFDGAAAIEAARRFAPDVVLCDVGLPGMTGYGGGGAPRGRRGADPPHRGDRVRAARGRPEGDRGGLRRPPREARRPGADRAAPRLR